MIELVVVIAVIAVLASLLAPGLSRAKAKAQRIQCASNLRQLGVAMHMFVVDRQNYPTGIDMANSDGDGRFWAEELERVSFGVAEPEPYFDEKGVWHCPSHRWLHFGPGQFPSYGYNAFGVEQAGNRTNAPGLFGNYEPLAARVAPITESEVANPSDLMAIGDSLFGSQIFFMRVDLAASAKWQPYSRHQGRANVLFCDGHIEPLTLSELFEDTGDGALSHWNRDDKPHAELLTH